MGKCVSCWKKNNLIWESLSPADTRWSQPKTRSSSTPWCTSARPCMTLSSRVSVCVKVCVRCVCVCYFHLLFVLFKFQCHWFSTLSLTLSALTLEDEKRSSALLINGFIRMVRLFRPLLFISVCFWSVDTKIAAKIHCLPSTPTPTEHQAHLFQLKLRGTIFCLRINAILMLWVFIAAVYMCVGPTTIKQQSHLLQRLIFSC